MLGNGNFLKKIFGDGSNNFLGVDIGASSIKIVQIKKEKGVAILETYGELSLGPYANIEMGRSTNLSSSELSQALKSLLQEANVTAKNCGVSIPLRSSLVFTMEMPDLDAKQLEQMIPIEARKYVPVPISEVDLDWRIIPHEKEVASDFLGEETENLKNKKQENKLEILVVAIHKDTVAKQIEVTKNAGLELKFLEIEIFSTVRAVTTQNVSCLAILDMGSGSTKLYIVERGVIRDSHTISRGSQDITLNISRSVGIGMEDAEKYKKEFGVEGQNGLEKEVSAIVSSNLGYVFSEANKVILNYRKKYNKNIDKLFITGGGSILKGMDHYASSNLDIETELADPFKKVSTPAFMEDLLKQVGPGFAVALGLALRGLK